MVYTRTYKKTLLELVKTGELDYQDGIPDLDEKRVNGRIADSLQRHAKQLGSKRQTMRLISMPRPVRRSPPTKLPEIPPQKGLRINKANNPDKTKTTETKTNLKLKNKPKSRIEFLKYLYKKNSFSLFFITDNLQDLDTVTKKYIHLHNKQIKNLLGASDKERLDTALELANQINSNDDAAIGVLDACVEYLVAHCYLFDDDFDNIDSLNLIDNCEAMVATIYIFIQDAVKNIHKVDVSNEIRSICDVYPRLSQPIYTWLPPFVHAAPIRFNQNLKP